MSQLTSEQWRAIAHAWRELGLVSASDLDAPVQTLLECFSALVDSPQGYVFLTRLMDRDPPPEEPMAGWRPIRVQGMGERLSMLMEAAEVWVKEGPKRAVDPLAAAMVERAGTVRCYRRCDLVPDAQWVSTAGAELLAQTGATDIILAARPITDELEFYITLHKTDGEFEAHDVSVLRSAMEGLDALCARYAMSLGALPGQDDLSPREREALSHMLAGLPEREIADHLGVTAGTAHQYVVSVYRKLGVNGRADLMARWLAGNPILEAGA